MKRAGGSKGLALVIVLWVVAALSVLVLGLSQTSRLQTQLTQYYRAETEARALLEAGLVVGMARAAGFGAVNQSNRYVFELQGVALQVDLHPATGFISVNGAPVDLLAQMFHYGAGLDTDRAERLAGAVARWREGGRRAPGERGAEQRKPFRVPEELALVPGVDRDLYDNIRLLITVYADSARVNPYAATRDVLAVVTGADAALVDAVMAQDRDMLEPRARLDAPLDGLPFLALSGSGTFRIDARVAWQGRAWRLSRWVRLDSHAGNALGVSILRTEGLRSQPIGEQTD
ncbi:type II secretion system minor pseudopilin [Thioalkalivibrio paradoxus]|uniref:Type II secretion system protein K n=1 Tax=Thioalkalivibrio paradoxus ARh 1 TaxID=713585 RepID=W0DNH4_9GAMM|nr:type II secretion system protein GspK [Thioalkalivibrio paradoxus]AHF00140.1 hypothetical protein THITH_10180 [Thioalkalivibrio paradoxus ARh 1]